MKCNTTITVTLDNGKQDVWRERDGDADSFAVEDGAFVVKYHGEAVAVYSLAHLVSAIAE